jgi:hypothetical protein
MAFLGGPTLPKTCLTLPWALCYNDRKGQSLGQIILADLSEYPCPPLVSRPRAA